jgi:predicted MFS family arabinose efflux permease
MGMYISCIYLGMMAGATAMGAALKRIGYPPGFDVAGGVVLATRLLFLVMMREQRQRSQG